jgi:DNA-binding beta-propeller fold protein YncE
MASRVMVGGNTYEVRTDWQRLPDAMRVVEVPGVAVGLDGRVYLLTRNPENPVIVLSPEGEFVTTFGVGVFTNRTHAIRAGADGYLYCVDDGSHTITKWTTAGELVMTIGTPGQSSPKFSGEPFNRPTDVALAPDGTLFISDGYGNARIHHYSADGERLASWGSPGIDPGQFMVPHNIALDGDRLYVADREAHRVQVFSPAGALLEVWNNIHRPCAVAVDAEHHVYVGELNAVPLMEGAPGMGHRVSIFDATGTLLGRIGEPEEGEAPGQFMAPHGLAVGPTGDVYVGEVSYTIRGSHMTPPRELKAFTRMELQR